MPHSFRVSRQQGKGVMNAARKRKKGGACVRSSRDPPTVTPREDRLRPFSADDGVAPDEPPVCGGGTDRAPSTRRRILVNITAALRTANDQKDASLGTLTKQTSPHNPDIDFRAPLNLGVQVWAVAPPPSPVSSPPAAGRAPSGPAGTSQPRARASLCPAAIAVHVVRVHLTAEHRAARLEKVEHLLLHGVKSIGMTGITGCLLRFALCMPRVTQLNPTAMVP